jgi:outer membrane immunogenic protein
MQFQGSDADVNLLAGGTSVNSCSNGSNCRMNYSESVQLARIGLNYKFGY